MLKKWKLVKIVMPNIDQTSNYVTVFLELNSACKASLLYLHVCDIHCRVKDIKNPHPLKINI